MKKHLFFIVFLLITSITYAQTVINPKIGVNTSRLSTDPKGGEVKARVGYQIGLDARIGDRVYFQPGLFWFKQSSRLRTAEQIDDNSLQEIEDDLNRQGLQLLTLVGFNIVDGEGFKFRINAGPAISIITTVDENDFDLRRDDFKGTNLTGNVGLGLDIFFLTLDYNYEFGFSDIFDNNTFSDTNFSDDPRIARNTFNVGVKFEF